MRAVFFRLQAALGMLALTTMTLSAAPAAMSPRHGEETLRFDGIPESSDEPARLEGYLDAREARLMGWSPAGELLITTRFGEHEQLHLVDHPLGMRRQLTFAPATAHGGSFCPDPNRASLAFLSAADGETPAQIFLTRSSEPTPRLLSERDSQSDAPLWSNSGRAIAFVSIAREGGAAIELLEPDSGAAARALLTGEGARLTLLDWSPDDSKLLVRRRSPSGADALLLVEVDGGKTRELEPSSTPVSIRDARFARSGQGVYLLSDRDAEYAQLRYVGLFGAERSVLSPHLAGDVEALALSRDGRYLAYASNVGGYSRLDAIDLRAHQDLILPKLPVPGVVGRLAFDPDGRRLAIEASAPGHPSDVSVLEMDSLRLTPWTASEAGAVPDGARLVPRLVEFPTFDRIDSHPRTLPAWIYEPATPGPHAVLVLLHDGPDGGYRPVFDPWISYLVNERHLAVVAPDLRGSSGHGRSFRMLDDGGSREDVIKDLGALLVWIGAQSGFDARHIVVAGVGYGGTLALDALVNFGDRLSGAIDAAGITDLPGYLLGAPPPLREALRAEFGDERVAETRTFLRRLSPLNNAERINRPVLIVHGGADRQVPVGESTQLLARLRARGQTVWYLEALRAGHEFERHSDQVACARVMAQFLSMLGE